MKRKHWRQNKPRPEPKKAWFQKSYNKGRSVGPTDMSLAEAIYPSNPRPNDYPDINPRPMSSVGDLYRRGGNRWEITQVHRDADGNIIYELLELDINVTEGPRIVRVTPAELSSFYSYIEGGRENIARPNLQYNIGDIFDSGGLRHWQIIDVYEGREEYEYLLREDAPPFSMQRLGHAELNRQMTFLTIGRVDNNIQPRELTAADITNARQVTRPNERITLARGFHVGEQRRRNDNGIVITINEIHPNTNGNYYYRHSTSEDSVGTVTSARWLADNTSPLNDPRPMQVGDIYYAPGRIPIGTITGLNLGTGDGINIRTYNGSLFTVSPDDIVNQAPFHET